MTLLDPSPAIGVMGGRAQRFSPGEIDEGNPGYPIEALRGLCSAGGNAGQASKRGAITLAVARNEEH